MQDKVKKRPWCELSTYTRKVDKTELDTGITVERSLIGNVEHIYVIDPETVLPNKSKVALRTINRK